MIRTKLFCTAIVLGISSAVTAQGSLISPPGYVTESEGPLAYSMLLGGYVEQRFQVADGNLRGKTLSLSQAELRRDTSPGYASKGRSWTWIQLQLGGTDLASFGESFAANAQQELTTVFEGPIHWPATPTGLSTSPAPWGTPGLSFPFSAPYLHDGSKDLLLDYQFAGGRRDDSQAWPAGSLLTYHLDGVSSQDPALGEQSHVGDFSCRDPRQQQAAAQRLFLWSHSQNHPEFPAQIRHQQALYHAAPLAPVLHALALQGNSSGIDLGACNKLFIQPLILQSSISDAQGFSQWSLGSAEYQPSYVGLEFWAQSAWEDSLNSALRLSPATRSSIPPRPEEPSWKMRMLTTTSQTLPLNSPNGVLYGPQFVPLHRYQSQ